MSLTTWTSDAIRASFVMIFFLFLANCQDLNRRELDENSQRSFYLAFLAANGDQRALKASFDRATFEDDEAAIERWSLRMAFESFPAGYEHLATIRMRQAGDIPGGNEEKLLLIRDAINFEIRARELRGIQPSLESCGVISDYFASFRMMNSHVGKIVGTSKSLDKELDDRFANYVSDSGSSKLFDAWSSACEAV